MLSLAAPKKLDKLLVAVKRGNMAISDTVRDSLANHAAEGGIFFLGDNLELLKKLPDESVDLVITSPPYNIGKSYESVVPIEDYLSTQSDVISECSRVLKPSGNLCWQVGFSVVKSEVLPLDALLYPIFKDNDLFMRNRIVWTFGHGLHAQKRFSGRHETVLWFSKSNDEYYFDLDSVRVPQLYPDKKHYRGPKKGQLSGNPLGKNPGDVWDIPNVKANHVEKTDHECQFPIALVQRLMRSLSPSGGVVLDPYAGVATTGCVAVLEGREYLMAELDKNYHSIGTQRLQEAESGTLRHNGLQMQDQKPYASEPGLFELKSVES